jgi:hypothetical protein
MLMGISKGSNVDSGSEILGNDFLDKCTAADHGLHFGRTKCAVTCVKCLGS